MLWSELNAQWLLTILVYDVEQVVFNGSSHIKEKITFAGNRALSKGGALYVNRASEGDYPFDNVLFNRCPFKFIFVEGALVKVSLSISAAAL